jgi:hypothetical protein
LLAGFGATGIAAGLGLLGTFLDVHLPLFDPSGLVLMAPVIIAPGFAGAVLRERDAVVAITAGAVAAPIAATFAIDGSCSSNVWAFFGLAAAAAYVLVIAGIAAFVGSWIGRGARSRINLDGTSSCWLSSVRLARLRGSPPFRDSTGVPDGPG